MIFSILNEEKVKSQNLMFGQRLLEYGIVTRSQIKKALARQAKKGGRIGSLLREMGYLDDQLLLNFLGKHYNVPSLNLFEARVSSNTLKLISFSDVKKLKALPVRTGRLRATFAMISPDNIRSINSIESLLSGKIKPVVIPFYQMERVIAYFENKGYGNNAFVGKSIRAENN